MMAGLQKLSKSVLRRDGAEQASRMEAVRTTAERLSTREAYAAEVSRLWLEAQDRFVAIGEYLVHAKETLPYGEYEKLRADVPRSAVDAFRRELRSNPGDRRGELTRERARLRKQIEAIRARLAEIEADIGPDRDQTWSVIESEATETSSEVPYG